MERFIFTKGQRNFTMGLMAVGLLSALVVFLTSESGTHQARLWSNLLHNSVFFGGISFITMFLLAAKALAYSGWHTGFKRLWEAFTTYLPVAFVTMLIIIVGLFMGWHQYHWNIDGVATPGSPIFDKVLYGKSGFLNKTMYAAFTIVVMISWILVARAYRKASLSEDDAPKGDLTTFKKLKVLGGIFLPLGGFSSAFLIWYWVMSVEPHWYSTLFAWYGTASWLVSAVALTILLLIYLKSLGYFANVTEEHFHDLGKYLFGFSVFWTYLWFSQYMLIWYANVGEETGYFRNRLNNYTFIHTANFCINFFLPFFTLIINTNKRRMGIMAFVSGCLLFGHWLDYFQMIKPGVYETATEIKHLESGKHHSSLPSDVKLLTQADAHGHEGQAQEATDAKATQAEQHGTATTHTAEPAHAQAAPAAHGDAHAPAAAHGEEGHGDTHHTANELSKAGFLMPGLPEIGMMLGFLGLFLFVVFSSLEKAPLLPKNDPYLEESLHHHVL
jgi:hypothetical protein